MIKLGNRIEIKECLNTTIYLDNVKVKGVKRIDISYRTKNLAGRKECSIQVNRKEDFDHSNSFAKELAKLGFGAEVLCRYGDFRIIEYYNDSDGPQVDIKIPGRGCGSSTYKIAE